MKKEKRFFEYGETILDQPVTVLAEAKRRGHTVVLLDSATYFPVIVIDPEYKEVKPQGLHCLSLGDAGYEVTGIFLTHQEVQQKLLERKGICSFRKVQKEFALKGLKSRAVLRYLAVM